MRINPLSQVRVILLARRYPHDYISKRFVARLYMHAVKFKQHQQHKCTYTLVPISKRMILNKPVSKG